ncbi:hypothetical protein JXA32_04165 [Candidatus Sumerlaeota bacterium]|nr:hypothetical protein [Candidatus Sumerlaeota bacterium]
MNESIFDRLIQRGNFQWLVLAAGALWLTACVAWAQWRASDDQRRFVLTLSAAGPLFIALWFIYNAIMDHFGLSSVAGMALNLALMIPAGLTMGYLLRGRQPHETDPKKDQSPAEDNADHSAR